MIALHIIVPIVTFLLGVVAGIGTLVYAFHIAMTIEGYFRREDNRPSHFVFEESPGSHVYYRENADEEEEDED